MTIYQRLATQTLGSSGTLSVDVVKMRWLKFQVHAIFGSNDDLTMQLGVDGGSVITSGGHYATTWVTDGSTTAYSEDNNWIKLIKAVSPGTAEWWCTGNIENQSGVWKFMNMQTCGSKGTSSSDGVQFGRNTGVLNNTGQITTIKIVNTLLAGSSITVYGADDTGSGTTYPNLPNGTTFLTSDTNKLYMWNGTDTWNEVG